MTGRSSDSRPGARRLTEWTRVVVVAEEALLAGALAASVREHTGGEPIVSHSLERAVRALRGDRDDLLVWLGETLDFRVADDVAALRRARPTSAVCLLCRRADTPAIRRVLASGNGHLAILLRGSLTVADVVACANEVLRHNSCLDTRVLEEIVRRDSDSRDVLDALTATELEILQLVAEGLSNREIAKRLWKSQKTIENGVGRLFAKLGLTPGGAQHLDRRVAATRIFLARRPSSLIAGVAAGGPRDVVPPRL